MAIEFDGALCGFSALDIAQGLILVVHRPS